MNVAYFYRVFWKIYQGLGDSVGLMKRAFSGLPHSANVTISSSPPCTVTSPSDALGHLAGLVAGLES